MTETATHRADLEPSLVSGRTYATRLRVMRIDAVVVLSIMTIFVTLIPFNLIVPGMTDLARPGLIVGLLLFGWWFISKFTWHLSMRGPQPLRWAILALMMTALLSYAVGFMRGLTTMEANGSDRAMLFFCVLAGAALMAADGIPTWLRLRLVLDVLVWCAGLMAIIGLIQYVFAFDVTKYFMMIPGLQAKYEGLGFMVRGSSYRVAGTTAHYIELATALSLVLPFAIHVALFGPGRWRRQVGLLCALVIAAGVGTTISRTGILAVAVMFIVLIPVWNWRMRFNVAVMGVGLLAVLTLASPGLVRTLFSLFNNPTSDSSVSARYERYPLVFHYVAQRPWLGRGTGTWIPPQYQILDNQWLVTLVANGVLGVIALAALHITGIVLASLALHRSTTAADRHLCAVLISTQTMALLVAATFDSLSFTTYATLMALTLGLCGTVWRLTHTEQDVRTSTTRWFLGGAYRSALGQRS